MENLLVSKQKSSDLDKLNVCQCDTIAEGFHVPLATFAKISKTLCEPRVHTKLRGV